MIQTAIVESEVAEKMAAGAFCYFGSLVVVMEPVVEAVLEMVVEVVQVVAILAAEALTVEVVCWVAGKSATVA